MNLPESTDRPLGIIMLFLAAYLHMPYRVLIFFLYNNAVRTIIKLINEENLSHRFALVFGESADKFHFFHGMPIDEIEHILVIGITAHRQIDGFEDYLLKHSLDPKTRHLWDYVFVSEWKHNPSLMAAFDSGNSTKHPTVTESALVRLSADSLRQALYADSVLAFAHALHNHINESCPKAFINKSHLAGCINGKKLLHHIRKLDIDGYSGLGTLAFDRRGDVKHPSYRIKYRNTSATGDDEMFFTFGIWNSTKNNGSLIFYMKDPIIADVHEKLKEVKSNCNDECSSREVKKGYGRCCNNCSHCSANEYISASKECNKCHQKTWPSPLHLNSCEPIPPTYIKWSLPPESQFQQFLPLEYGIVIFSYFAVIFGVLGILTTCVLMGLIIFYRSKSKLIKASSPELCIIILIGALIGFVSMFMFMGQPTIVICYLKTLFFNISGTLTYGALLTKTVRIYRIFSASRKFRKRIRFVSLRSQIAIVTFISAIQVMILVICLCYHDIRVDDEMPNPNERYVEVHCHQADAGFIPPIVFNSILLFICCAFSFKTRSAHDNFNECLYINIITSLTCVLWIIIGPTYFLLKDSYQMQLIIIEMLAVLIDCIILISCLFLPKFYAVLFLEETQRLIYLKDPNTGAIYTAKKHLTDMILNEDKVVEISLNSRNRKQSKDRRKSSSAVSAKNASTKSNEATSPLDTSSGPDAIFSASSACFKANGLSSEKRPVSQSGLGPGATGRVRRIEFTIPESEEEEDDDEEDEVDCGYNEDDPFEQELQQPGASDAFSEAVIISATTEF